MSAGAYAITAEFKSISTDPNSRHCVSVKDGIDKAMANLKYIARPSATDQKRMGALIYRTHGITGVVDMNRKERKKFFAMCRKRIEARSKKHKAKTGVRLLDKAVISLPSDADGAQRLEMAQLIIEQFGGDSEAMVVAAIHIDRPGNPHLHLWAVDGLESPEQAKGRAAKRDLETASTTGKKKKTRARRRDYIRLGELGSRAKARLDVAAIINVISNKEGLKRAETRSLKEQGLARKPQVHEGPQAAAKGRRSIGKSKEPITELTNHVKARVVENALIIVDNHRRKSPKTEPVPLGIFPKRLRPIFKSVIRKFNEKAAHLPQRMAAENCQNDKKQPDNKATHQPSSSSEIPTPDTSNPSPPAQTAHSEKRINRGSDGDFFGNMFAENRHARTEQHPSTTPTNSEKIRQTQTAWPEIEPQQTFKKKATDIAIGLGSLGAAFAKKLEEVSHDLLQSNQKKMHKKTTNRAFGPQLSNPFDESFEATEIQARSTEIRPQTKEIERKSPSGEEGQISTSPSHVELEGPVLEQTNHDDYFDQRIDLDREEPPYPIKGETQTTLNDQDDPDDCFEQYIDLDIDETPDWPITTSQKPHVPSDMTMPSHPVGERGTPNRPDQKVKKANIKPEKSVEIEPPSIQMEPHPNQADPGHRAQHNTSHQPVPDQSKHVSDNTQPRKVKRKKRDRGIDR